MTPQTAVLLLLAVGVVIVGVGVVSLVRQRNPALRERLDRYSDVTGGGRMAAAAAAAAAPRTSPVADRLNQYIARRGLFAGVSTSLAQADLKMTPAEWLALHLIAFVGAGALGYLLFHQNLAFSLIAGVAGLIVPQVYLGMRRGQRKTRFNNQLSDVLNLWVNALRSGYSVLQALDAMARELPAPASIEFARVVQEVRLGVPMEAAMNNLLRRVPSDDLDLVITAVNVQREVGGNLAEILEVIGHTIRERVRIKGDIEVLTAQQMYGGYVISLLPVVLMAVLYIINPNYVGRLILPGRMQPCGWIMIGIGVVMILAGFFAIQRIVRIDV